MLIVVRAVSLVVTAAKTLSGRRRLRNAHIVERWHQSACWS